MRSAGNAMRQVLCRVPGAALLDMSEKDLKLILALLPAGDYLAILLSAKESHMPAPRETAEAKRLRIAQELAELERDDSAQGQQPLSQDSAVEAGTATTERRPRHALAPVYPRGWQHTPSGKG